MLIRLFYYVLITRYWGGENTAERYGSQGHRQKVRSESSDFLHWSKPEFAIKGLDLRMQIHDMPVVKHAGVYLGMVGLFDVEANKQLAAGELVAKTVTDAAVRWKNGFALKQLAGQEIKLSFELRDAKIYSFSFE